MTVVHVYGAFVPSLNEGISANVDGLCSALRRSGTPVRQDCVPVDLAGLNRRRSLASAAWAAARCVRKARRDPRTSLVHLHASLLGTAAPSTWSRATSFGERRGAPLLVHGWNAYYAASPATAALPRADRLAHRLANGPEAAAFALRPARDVVVSSRFQAAQLAAIGFRGRTHLVPNGVDLERHRPRTTAEAEAARALFGLDGDPVLLYYGHASPWKGLPALVQALPHVLREHPRAQVLLSLTAYGDRAWLDAALRSRRLEGRVRIVGPQRVADLHAAADLAVFPAPGAVGSACFPNVLLECLAGGVPVVATAVGSVPEAVQHGRTGLLAQPGDAGSLARVLLDLAGDPVLRRRLAVQARRVAEAELGWDASARAMQAVYRSLGVDAVTAPEAIAAGPHAIPVETP